jgi:hypothetical protein
MHAQVLSAVGLRSQVDRRTFLACAREVEAWAPDLAAAQPARRAELLRAARLLVQELESNLALHSANLFAAVKDLAFVPATQACTRLPLLTQCMLESCLKSTWHSL